MKAPMHISSQEKTEAPIARVNLDSAVKLLIFLAVFAGCQGGRYYMANRLQELGIACAVLLFGLGAWRAFFRLSTREWKRWVVAPILLIIGIMLISSVVFTINFNGNVLYSFFSAREFLLGFSGPGIYLLVRSGMEYRSVERVVWFALIALMLNYLFFYTTMDLRAAFFSSDHTISNLVTYDEWRGFRLKPPLFAVMVCLSASVMLLLQSRRPHIFAAAVVILSLALFIWSIVMFRSTLATLILSMLLYPIFISSKNRLTLIVVIAPLLVLFLPWVAQLSLSFFLDADGGSIRGKAFALAFEQIPQHFFLGAGEDSAYGDSYQDLVAPYFYPSDLGLVGTFYKYGLLGTLLYLGMHCKIWISLWRANTTFTARHQRHNALLWGFLIFMTAQSFNLALNPGLAYAQGITLGTLALALARLQSSPLNHDVTNGT